MKNPALMFASLVVTGALVLAGCSTDATDSTEATANAATTVVADSAADSTTVASTSSVAEVQYEDLDIKEMDTEVDVSRATPVTLADGASTGASGVSVDGDTVTITAGGTYILSGTLTAGSIVIDAADEDVTVVLDGVDVTAAGVGAFNVVEASNVLVYLAEGSHNSLSDADGAAVDETDEDAPNAAMYSSADLWIAGSGELAVTGVNDGITSKDSLVIASGTVTVTAGDDGVRGKDHLVILDGTLTVDAGGDALKSDNEGKEDDPDAVVGVIWIEGGTLNLKAGSDAADAARQVTINGGDLEIAAGDDGLHSDAVLRIADGTINITESEEGIEGAYVYLSGGDVVVVAADDGINVSGGLETSEASEAAVVTDAAATTTDTPADAQMAGGGQRPGGDSMTTDQTADGGNSSDPRTSVTVATDLGDVTVSDLEDGGFGGPAEEDNGDRFLEVSGGTFIIDTESDGVDVNGSMTMTGGTIVVTSTSDNDQGAIDVDDTFTLTGGTLAANGASGMAVGPEAGGQGSLGIMFSLALPAETVITITDSSGSDVASFETSKVSQSVIYSSADLVLGDEYSVTIGGTASGTNIGNLIVDGTSDGGVDAGTVTAQ
ncbi:carbohydrate-binding domain-containing protein [Demequina aurantiaca]|uniref:carbohydrate-binding domain-containing protein n=1 Tax=Demequina aurantiaca TaxID=676200 RepID=UPI003D33B39E